jgi:type II secretory pathway component PulK
MMVEVVSAIRFVVCCGVLIVALMMMGCQISAQARITRGTHKKPACLQAWVAGLGAVWSLSLSVNITTRSSIMAFMHNLQ